MTFKAKIIANRIFGAVSTIIGLAILAFITYYLTVFVIFAVAEQKITLGIMIGFIAAYSFGMGFAVRSIFRDNIDIIISRMGPIQRQTLKSALEEDKRGVAQSG